VTSVEIPAFAGMTEPLVELVETQGVRRDDRLAGGTGLPA